MLIVAGGEFGGDSMVSTEVTVAWVLQDIYQLEQRCWIISLKAVGEKLVAFPPQEWV